MELRWIVLTFTLCCVRNVYTADPVLSWTSWTDSVGNTADQNSDVTFAPIPMPSNLTYKGGAIEYDSRGLEPLYKFTKAFINGAVFPYGLDWSKYYGVCTVLPIPLYFTISFYLYPTQ